MWCFISGQGGVQSEVEIIQFYYRSSMIEAIRGPSVSLACSMSKDGAALLHYKRSLDIAAPHIKGMQWDNTVTIWEIFTSKVEVD